MPFGTDPDPVSSGIALVICAVVTALVSVGFRPTATPCWLNGPAGIATEGAPSVKFAGGAACGSDTGGTSGASIRVPLCTFAVVASSTGLPVLLYQAFVFTLSTLLVNVGKNAN